MKSYLFSLLVLLIPLLLIPASAQESTIRLTPTDDTFVLADYSNPDEIKSLQEKPLGDLDVITSWYSWDFAPGKKIMSTVFLKFDLKNISPNELDSAKLLLYANKTNIVEQSPNVAIYSVIDTSWSEKDLTYGGIDIHEIISDKVMIYQPGLYEWDITQYIIDNAGSEISIGVNFSRIVSEHIEQIFFVSKDSSKINYRPVLIITSTLGDSTTNGGCLIATATFGSELSPQVQFLREIRDTQLMNTNSGTSFMSSFNQFYYSFSPYIADMERESPVFKEVVKIGITPLLSSLSIMSYADSESKVLGYGIGVILMNVGMYFVAPALIIMKILLFHKDKKN